MRIVMALAVMPRVRLDRGRAAGRADKECREQECPTIGWAPLASFYSISGELCRVGMERHQSTVFIACSTVKQ
jgi:hypothetical protein